MKLNKLINLTRQIELKGQLIPTSINNSKSDFALALKDGRMFSVFGNSDWYQIISQHLWDEVVISGVVDYKNKTINISDLYSDEKLLDKSSLDFFDTYDSDALYDLVDRAQKGYLIS